MLKPRRRLHFMDYTVLLKIPSLPRLGFDGSPGAACPRQLNPPDPVVPRIGKIERAVGPNRHAPWRGQLRLGCRPAVATETPRPRACHCGDDAIGVNLTNAMVADVHDVQRAVRSERKGTDGPQSRIDGRSSVPSVSKSRTHYGGDHSLQVDTPDSNAVGYQYAPIVSHRHRPAADSTTRRRAAVSTGSERPVAGKGMIRED